MTSTERRLIDEFPPLRSNHGGTWAPLYMEPLVGSGERLCIGVIAFDAADSRVVPVPDIERLACAYGPAADAFAWAAWLIVKEAEYHLALNGPAGLAEWASRIEGLIVGDPRKGAGRNLEDLAQVALRQVSSLATPARSLWLDRPVAAAEPPPELKPVRLDSEIRRLAVQQNPLLVDRFFQSYRTSQSARPLRFAYVGRKLVANFAALDAKNPSAVSRQVDRAKARLWDLQQLKSGVLADSLNLRPASMQFKLLVHRPLLNEKFPPAPIVRTLREAEEELEAEADKALIRFLPMRTTKQMADYLVSEDAR